MNIPHLVYPFIYQCHLRGFYLLTIVNNATINIGVEILFKSLFFNSFGYISRPTHVWKPLFAVILLRHPEYFPSPFSYFFK